jgi:hypothetical protein
MSVITISRQTGSDGERLGLGLAAALGWRYIDRATIHRAAKAAGVPDLALAELAYKGRRSFLERLLGALRLEPSIPSHPERGEVEVVSAPLRLMPLLPPVTNTVQDYVDFIGELINAMADEGQLVIVGSAGQVILAERPDTFHIQVIAPFELRVARLRARSGEPRQAAIQKIRASDDSRAEYLRRFYHEEWHDALLYDLIINSAHLDLEAAIKLTALGWKAKCATPPHHAQPPVAPVSPQQAP